MKGPKSYPNARDCEHGRQRGKCVDCDFADADRELDAIATIPEVGAADGAGVEAVRNAIEHLKAVESGQRARIAELEARLLRPELPPYTDEGDGLPRYGLQWPTPNRVLSVPMPDGYWTPFHLAEAAVAAEREACAIMALGIPDPDPEHTAAQWLRSIIAADIRARGGEVARETECRCGHSHAAHKGTGYSCLGSASPRESCACRLFVKRGGQ